MAFKTDTDRTPDWVKENLYRHYAVLSGGEPA